MIKTIVWDWNGTLLNDVECCFSILQKLMAERDLNPIETLEEYKEVFRFPVKEMYQELGFDLETEDFSNLSQEYMNHYRSNYPLCTLHQQVKDILLYCQESGIKNVLLSASMQSILEEQANFYKCIHYFDDCLGIDNIEASSKKELAQKWIKRYPMDAAEILWVGDSTHDFECAKSCGIPCVLISHGHQSEGKLREVTDCVISQLDEIKEMIETKRSCNFEI